MDLTTLRAVAWTALVYVWTLAAEHPAITTLIVGSLVSRLLKPRTPTEYAVIASRHPTWFFDRWAAILQLIGAVFVDTVKIEKILLEKILQGPPKPPSGGSVLPPPNPPPRNLSRLRLGSVAIAATMTLTTAGCALLTRENAKSAVDSIQLGCIFATELTDEEAVAEACGVARDLIPIVKNLIGQREGAKRAGVRWPDAGVAVDAGAD